MEEYESVEIKKIYNMLWLNGGILRDKKVKRVWKTLWVTYQIWSAIFITLSYVSFIFYTKEKNIHYLVLIILPSLIVHHSIAVNYHLIRNFNEFVEFLNSLQPKIRAHSSHVPIFSKSIKLIIITVTSLPLIMNTLNAINFYESENPNFRDLTGYFYPPFEFIEINSLFIYTIISLIQILTLAPTIYSSLVFLITIEFFVRSLRDKFDNLRERTAISSKFLQRDLETSHQKELEYKNRNRFRTLWIKLIEKSKRKKSSIRFSQQMNEYVEKFNTLARSLLFLKKLSQPIISLFILHGFGVLVAMGHVLLTTIKHPKLYKDSIQTDILAFTAILFVLYKHISFGSHLQEMIEKTTDVIYSTPWYLLPPKYRKNIHIFLCLSQKKTSLMVLKMLPIDYTLLPSLLNTAYSYIMVLQTLMDRQQ